MYSSYTALLTGGILVGLCVTGVPETGADPTTYLINITVRHGYPELMQDVAADLGTADQHQASYLIAQAVNKLCPASIWTLRNSAAHYNPKTA